MRISKESLTAENHLEICAFGLVLVNLRIKTRSLQDHSGWRHYTQHNDIQNNDTQQNNKKVTLHNNIECWYGVSLYWASHFLLVCWVLLCRVSLFWMSLFWMSLCWMSWRIQVCSEYRLKLCYIIVADILACLLDLNVKQSKLTRLNFKQAYLA